MKKFGFVFSVLCLLLIWSCGNSGSDGPNSGNTNVAPGDKVDLTEFYEFYNFFHSDTAYQVAHINFPLEGKPSQEMGLSQEEKFYWQREDWAFHKPIDFQTSPYKRKITPITDELVVEYIVHGKLGFGMIRRFAKLGNQWFLIYYEGMKPLVDAPE